MDKRDALTRLEDAQRELDCLAAALEAACGSEAPRPQMVIEHAALETGRIADELDELVTEFYGARRKERGDSDSFESEENLRYLERVVERVDSNEQAN